MKNNIDFTIIVPAYNSSQYIDKCIRSVLSQTYDNYELIIVDDGSIDDTLYKCKLYEATNEKVKVLHKNNGGHTSARNKGLEEARGNYIIFLDSDDWISNKTLEECINEYNKNNPDIIVFSIKKSTSQKPLPIYVKDGLYTNEDLKKIINKNLIYGSNGKSAFLKSLSGKCFKKEIVYNYQLNLPKEITIGEDGLVFIESVINSKSLSVISKASEACYIIYERENSVSKSSDKFALQKNMIAFKCYNNILKTNSALIKQINRNVVMQIYTSILFLLRSNASDEYINKELEIVFENKEILNQFKKARFNIDGYKCIMKKIIISHRMWNLARRYR